MMVATILVTLFWFNFLTGSYSATLEIINKCNYTVWPGSAGTSPFSVTGLTLQPGDSIMIPVPPGWRGQLWGRTLCYHDDTGKFSCVTGDCGSSTMECAGGKASPPVTVVELGMNSTGGVDLLEVSVVEGFNLAVMVEADGSGKCEWRGCVKNLNEECPPELKVTIGGEAVACKTAERWNSSFYSHFFKTACPRARVYAYDNSFTTFPCVSSRYRIIFCPTIPSTRSINSMKAAKRVGKSIMAVVSIVVSILSLVACTVSIRINISRRDSSIGAEAEAEAGTRAQTSRPGN